MKYTGSHENNFDAHGLPLATPGNVLMTPSTLPTRAQQWLMTCARHFDP
jgi:hypothetical protein